jgi:hypothetical protein
MTRQIVTKAMLGNDSTAEVVEYKDQSLKFASVFNTISLSYMHVTNWMFNIQLARHLNYIYSHLYPLEWIQFAAG